MLWDEDWHEGVIGIVASRLVERFNRPVVLIAGTSDGWKGSGRSISAFDLHAALDACCDHLERFGGHRAAAGLSIRTEQLEAFAEAFAAHADGVLADDDLRHVQVVDAIVPAAALTLDLAQELDRLAPFGMGNPDVTLLVAAVEAVEPATVGEGKHLRFRVRQHGRDAGSAIAFGLGAQLERLSGEARYDLVFRLKENRWNGTVAPQLVVRRLFDSPAGYEELRSWLTELWLSGEPSWTPEARRIFGELGLVGRGRSAARHPSGSCSSPSRFERCSRTTSLCREPHRRHTGVRCPRRQRGRRVYQRTTKGAPGEPSGLQVRLDEPELLVERARRLGEQVGRCDVARASPPGRSRRASAAAQTASRSATTSSVSEPSIASSGYSSSEVASAAMRTVPRAAPPSWPTRSAISSTSGSTALGDVVVELVQLEEIGSPYDPVRLLRLRVQVEGVGQARVQQVDELAAGVLADVDSGRELERCLRGGHRAPPMVCSDRAESTVGAEPPRSCVPPLWCAQTTRRAGRRWVRALRSRRTIMRRSRQTRIVRWKAYRISDSASASSRRSW